MPISKGLRSRYQLEELIPDGLIALLTQLTDPEQQPQSETERQSRGETNSIIEETRLHTRGEIEKYLISLVAGRAAEEIACGATTAGASGSESSDLARATVLALRLETVYGLGATGLAHIPGGPERLLLVNPHLLAAVQASLDRAYAAAKDILNANRASLDALATALFERGHLDAAEIDVVLQKTPLARTASGSDAALASPLPAETSERDPDNLSEATLTSKP